MHLPSVGVQSPARLKSCRPSGGGAAHCVRGLEGLLVILLAAVASAAVVGGGDAVHFPQPVSGRIGLLEGRGAWEEAPSHGGPQGGRHLLKAYGRIKGRASGKDWSQVQFTPEEQQFITSTVTGAAEEARCLFFTQECVTAGKPLVTGPWWRYAPYLGRLREPETVRRHPALYSKLSQEEWQRLPSVKERGWGRCAFVAYGSNLLSTPRGAQIDAYDTVVRIGLVPLQQYAKYAGTKVTMTYVRHRKLRRSRGKFAGVDRNGNDISKMGGNVERVLISSYHETPSHGFNILSFGGDLAEPVSLVMNKLLRKFVPRGDIDATSGMVLPLHLLYARYCTEIGLFGISMDGGHRYWDKAKRPVASNHNTALEARIWQTLAEASDRMPTPVKYYT